MTFSDFQNERRNNDDSDNENMFDPGQNTFVQHIFPHRDKSKLMSLICIPGEYYYMETPI